MGFRQYNHPVAILIEGLKLRKVLFEGIKAEVQSLKERWGRPPGLATILVGNHAASLSYVKLKMESAKLLGYEEFMIVLPEETEEKKLLSIIEDCNQNSRVDGILVQLPLPEHICEKRVLRAVSVKKDVDGFHPLNGGRLFLSKNWNDNRDFLIPCTPQAIIEILKWTGIQTQGKEALVVGRSNTVGKPVALMLLQKGIDANVTVMHSSSSTESLKAACLRSDVVIASAGIPSLIKGAWVKEGACVVDVGVNRVGEIEREGRKIPILRGDVEFEEAFKRAAFITPVPGGVGPMTIAMLMKNTLASYKRRLGQLNSGP